MARHVTTHDGRAMKVRLFVMALLCFALAAAASATLRLAFGPRPVFIHVRWAPIVDGTLRQGFERRHRLADAEQLEGQTFGYSLLDTSDANVRALVTNPAVEDTTDLDREAFHVLPTALLRPYATQYPRIPGTLTGLTMVALFIGLVAGGLGVVEFARPDTVARWVARRSGIDPIFILIIVTALAPRIYLAATELYIYDEDSSSIPRSQMISFALDNLQLPLRGQNHPALPAYFVKISSLLFGTTPLGYRLFHVLVSLATIALVFFLTRHWYGAVAARWAAALLAFNEYYLTVSARATAHVPYLLFVGGAVYAFGRFLSTQRPGYLYAAGASLGLAFYSKEHSALLVPVFAVTMLLPDHRHWFRRWHLYVAAALYVIIISADLVWNVRASQDIGQATYSDHLQRIGGIGFSPYPLMFFGREAVQWLHTAILGNQLDDHTREYLSMNPALGLILLGAVALTMAMATRAVPVSSRFLLLLFWGVFGFFSLIRPGDPQKNLDPVSWIWVDATLFPTVILAGAALAHVRGAWRTATWTLACGALLYASAQVIG